MEVSEAIVDKRISSDRREFGWRTIFFGFTRSRRHNHRRETDAEVLFLDRGHPWLFFLAVGTMLLSCTDAVLTLALIDFGFYEANPFMASVMGQGTAVFAATKMALTGFGILTLVFLAKAHFLDRFRTGLFLTIFFLAYACLVCYETVNLLRFL